MNTICKLILVGPIALMLWACSDSAEPGHSDNDADHSSQTTTDADGAQDQSGAADADQASGAGGVTTPVNALQNDGANEPENAGDERADDDEESEDEEYDLARLGTPDSALKYWIELMSEADYFGVLFASDSGSQEYQNLRDMAESIEAAQESEDPQKRMVVPLIRMVFSDPWTDAEFEELDRSEGRVRFTVTWTNGYQVPVDVNQMDEQVWRVLVTNEMLQPDKDRNIEDVLPPQDGGGGNGAAGG